MLVLFVFCVWAGVGVAYSVKKRSMSFNITCLRRPEKWSTTLSHYLQEALLDMRNLCEQASEKLSKL